MRCAGRRVMVSPAKQIRPACTVVSPLMVLSSVDLPATFGPITETTSPSSNSRSTPFNIRVRPYPDSIRSTASSVSDLVDLSGAAKIGLLYRGVGEHFRRTAGEQQLALVKHVDVVRERHDETHVVLDNQHDEI